MDFMSVDSRVLTSLDDRSKTIVLSCVVWFNKDQNRCLQLLDILQRKVGFSLRSVDWLLTNFSKRNPVFVFYENAPINVHSNYERFLSTYSKKYFDVFARREKFSVVIVNSCVQVTVGQLNFFRWFLERQLHAVVLAKRCEIDSDMKSYHKRGVNVRGTSAPAVTVHKGSFVVGFL